MHIPDGFLTTGVSVAACVASGASVCLMARRAQGQTEESRAPLLGVMGAFVFAAQMVNFPVGMGTTGHLVGAALLTITLGPSAAVVVMTAIIAIQALVFQDGGVLAMGANVFNMAVAGVAAGYLPYRLLGSGRTRSLGIFLAGVLSVMTGALLALGELLLSGVAMPRPVVALSIGLFGLNAAVEGAITLGVVQALERTNAGWVRGPERLRRPAMVAVSLASVLLVSAGVLIASSAPDGLMRLAQRLGIASRATQVLETPFADYETAFVSNAWLSKTTAGVVGLALVYGCVVAIGRFRAGKKSA